MVTQTDRNLLLGILAVQMDFVSRDQLIAAMHAWVLDKSRPLEDFLVEQGALGEDTRTLLLSLVAKHLEIHAGDPHASLARIAGLGGVDAELDVGDPELTARLRQAVTKGGKPSPPNEQAAAAGDSTMSFAGREPNAAGMRFQILRPFARGGLGEVFVAEDTEVSREVALKQIRAEFADDPNSRARFIREAEITGGLEHPAIVPVYGLGRYPDGRPFYAMRLVRGDSLETAVDKLHQRTGPKWTDKSLEFRSLLGHFVAVCQAIEYAHRRRVLHRDLKPGNIILGDYGESLVVDWGLAKVAGPMGGVDSPDLRPLPSSSGSGPGETRAGTALGTPAYMSPEQAAGRLDDLGPTSDVYSLGATLYFMLTGKPPFSGNDLGLVLRQVEAGDFPKPRRRNRRITRSLEAICLKAMATRPADRYSTPQALASDIDRWLADDPVTAYRENIITQTRRFLGLYRRPMLSALILFLLLTDLGILFAALVLRLMPGHFASMLTAIAVPLIVTGTLLLFQAGTVVGALVGAVIGLIAKVARVGGVRIVRESIRVSAAVGAVVAVLPSAAGAFIVSLGLVALLSTSPATTLFEQQRVIDAYNELAWLQATGSAEVRNGQEAVRNALVACQLANHRDPSCLDTLAAAYAETGDFEQAVGTQEAAIRLLSEVGDEGSILPNLQRRLEAYRSGRPYRGER